MNKTSTYIAHQRQEQPLSGNDFIVLNLFENNANEMFYLHNIVIYTLKNKRQQSNNFKTNMSNYLLVRLLTSISQKH